MVSSKLLFTFVYKSNSLSQKTALRVLSYQARVHNKPVLHSPLRIQTCVVL